MAVFVPTKELRAVFQTSRANFARQNLRGRELNPLPCGYEPHDLPFVLPAVLQNSTLNKLKLQGPKCNEILQTPAGINQ